MNSTYDKFEYLLRKHGLTAATVSKETGIAQSTLTEWKKGKYTPKTDKIKKIAEYFDVQPDYFYGEGTIIERASQIPNEAFDLLRRYYELSLEQREVVNDYIDFLSTRK